MNAPIIDVVFDIWFESDIPSEALLGIILENFKSYTNIQSLPLLQIPKDMRLMDPNLKHQALYEILSNEKPYKIVLGHQSLGIALNKEYAGWSKSFFPEIKELYQKIFEKKIISKVTRCGLRYIDFFQEENILNTGKIDIKINNSPINEDKILLRIEKSLKNNINMAIVIDNLAIFKKIDIEKKGSIVDIASFVDNEGYIQEQIRSEKFYDIINELHTTNKNYFKEVSNEKLIKQLGI